MGSFKRVLHRLKPGKGNTAPPTTSSSTSGGTPASSVHPDASSQTAGPSSFGTVIDASCTDVPVSIQSAPVATIPERGSDDFGLFTMSPDPQSISITERDPATGVMPKTYSMDIVAVHGLTGDAYKTWTHENGKLWLRDFLSEDLRGARIFSFGYDASVLFTKARGNIETFADALLALLEQARTSREEKARPLVFICHSMGGIVVKQAIVTALTSDMYENIRSSCLGIMFIATPHRGSEAVAFAIMLSKIANTATTLVTSRFFGRSNKELLKSLKDKAPGLAQISRQFANQARTYNIATLFETDATPPFKERIVERDSAETGLAGEKFFPMQGCNHTSICRFSERNNNYKYIVGVLTVWWDERNPSQSMVQEYLPINDSIHSLKFPEMDHKRLDLDEKKNPKTSGWILQLPSYIAWERKAEGILWIKGKPGAGKSTVMRDLAESLEWQKSSGFIVLTFFFDAFGDPSKPLKSSAAGMYRVLLFQLLEQIRPAACRFKKRFDPMKPEVGLYNWCEKDLSYMKIFLRDELKALDESAKIRILVDAIDEATDGTVADISKYLSRLTYDLGALRKDIQVCVSSRHYPIASIEEKYTIVLEKENLKAISNFVEDEFFESNILSRSILEANGTLSDLKNSIVEKSAGVFLWVAWAPRAVIDRLNSGFPMEDVVSQLDIVPLRIGNTYSDMLNNLIKPEESKDAYFLLSWATKAGDPMYLSRLATDVKFSIPFNLNTEDPGDGYEAVRLGLFVGSHAGGLMEAHFPDARQKISDFTATFIHHTVRVFLRQIGLEQLHGKLLLAKDDNDVDDNDDNNYNGQGVRKTRPLHPGSESKNHIQSEHNLPIDHTQLEQAKQTGSNETGFSSPDFKNFEVEDDDLIENRSLTSDRWFEDFDREILPLTKFKLGSNKVKIAVLGSGFDVRHQTLFEAREAGQLHSIFEHKGIFVDFVDKFGHGSFVAGLLLRMVPFADIYMANVASTRLDQNIDPSKVEEAIVYATYHFEVDIIVIPFSLSTTEPTVLGTINEAINKAYQKDVIMLAANQSHGRNFPASLSQVLSISSVDGYGMSSTFNSTLEEDENSFSILGEAIGLSWAGDLNAGGRSRKSGASFATAIAAGVAASVIQFGRQTLPAGSPELSTISSLDGMRLLFSSMSSSRERSRYIVPWKLLTANLSEEENVRKVLRVLGGVSGSERVHLTADRAPKQHLTRDISEVHEEAQMFSTANLQDSYTPVANESPVARALLQFQFPKGYYHVLVEGTGPLRGARALRASIGHTNIRPLPTISQLLHVFEHEDLISFERSLGPVERRSNVDNFDIDKLAMVLRLWGAQHNLTLRLGWILADRRSFVADANRARAPMEQIIWIATSSITGGENGNVTHHYDGVRPSLKIPSKKAIYLPETSQTTSI